MGGVSPLWGLGGKKERLWGDLLGRAGMAENRGKRSFWLIMQNMRSDGKGILHGPYLLDDRDVTGDAEPYSLKGDDNSI